MLAVHHIAIKVRDLEICERFYSGLLELPVVGRQCDPGGELRSIWLDAGGTLLMLERGDGDPDHAPLEDPAPGLHLLAFRIPAAARTHWAEKLDVVSSTDYTLYVRDPEGNRIGLSHFPEAAREGVR